MSARRPSREEGEVAIRLVRRGATDEKTKALAAKLIPLYEDLINRRTTVDAYSDKASKATLEWEKETGCELLDYLAVFCPLMPGLNP